MDNNLDNEIYEKNNLDSNKNSYIGEEQNLENEVPFSTNQVETIKVNDVGEESFVQSNFKQNYNQPSNHPNYNQNDSEQSYTQVVNEQYYSQQNNMGYGDNYANSASVNSQYYNQNPYQEQHQNQYNPQTYHAPINPNYYAPPVPTQKKKNGSTAFLVILSVVAGLSIFGFIFVLVADLIEDQNQNNHNDYFSGFDPDKFPFASPNPDYDFNEDWGFAPVPTQPPEQPNPDEDIEYTEGLPEGFIENPNIKVEPNTNGLKINKSNSLTDLDPEEVYEKVVVSTVSVEVQVPSTIPNRYIGGQGSGVIITEDGFILTNSHVVEDSKSAIVKVIDHNGKEYPAVVVGVDKGTDLAVLKIDAKGLIPAEFGNSNDLKMGEWVMAIGNPGGTDFSGSITRGVVSGLERQVGYATKDTMRYIQTDAAINPGNSGGALVNMHGQVIGINTSKIVADYYEGMGFAIPTVEAKKIVDEILEFGYVQGRVRLGITATNANSGVEIVEIAKDSSFANTEVQAGDIITKVDGEEVTELSDMSAKFLSYSPGDVVTVELKRTGFNMSDVTYEVEITLLADNGETQK